MGLLTEGYWPTTYFPADYWHNDYWPNYGAVAPAVTPASRTVMIPRENRTVAIL